MEQSRKGRTVEPLRRSAGVPGEGAAGVPGEGAGTGQSPEGFQSIEMTV